MNAARQASLSTTNSRSSLKLTSISVVQWNEVKGGGETLWKPEVSLKFYRLKCPINTPNRPLCLATRPASSLEMSEHFQVDSTRAFAPSSCAEIKHSRRTQDKFTEQTGDAKL